MIDHLVQQFLASELGQQALVQLTAQGLDEARARETLGAATDGAAGQLGPSFGRGGATNGGLPPQALDDIANTVARRTGMSPALARSSVTAVLPKVLEFLRTKTAVAGSP